MKQKVEEFIMNFRTNAKFYSVHHRYLSHWATVFSTKSTDRLLPRQSTNVHTKESLLTGKGSEWLSPLYQLFQINCFWYWRNCFSFLQNISRPRPMASTAQPSWPAMTDSRWACYSNFHIWILQRLVIRYSVCPWQAFPAQSNVCM
jgi:hypothetical protein